VEANLKPFRVLDLASKRRFAPEIAPNLRAGRGTSTPTFYEIWEFVSPIMVRSERWGTFSWRSSTLSLERAGSRRTTSPSLRFSVQLLTADLPSIPLPGTWVNKAYLSVMVSTRLLTSLVAVTLLIFSLVALLPDCASACTCAYFGGSPQQRAERMLDESAAVFAGKVVDLKRGFKKGPYGSVNKVSFRVSEVWKGPKRETLELTTPSQGSACAYSFSKGRKYLVDATGKMSVNICSETKPLSEASELVEALGNGETPGEGGGVLVDTSGGFPPLWIIGMIGLGVAAVSLVAILRLVRTN
jgi:hypothetical protein